MTNKENLKSYLHDVRHVSAERIRDYLSSLDRLLPSTITTTLELKTHLKTCHGDTYTKALKNIFNYMEYCEFDIFNSSPIDKWRKSVKIQKTGVRENFISTGELMEAYMNISPEFKPLFKLILFSGCRLSQALEGLKNIENTIIIDNIARIPLGSTAKGQKKAFWMYFPSIFFEETKKINTPYKAAVRGIAHRRVTANSLRKWHLNFLIEQGIQMEVANFIQGRSSTDIGSVYYLNKTKTSDSEYSRIVPHLLNIFNDLKTSSQRASLEVIESPIKETEA
ncbi:MAG: hypothetical protein EFT35_07790 [Methanophagales archaeon ANME-1-THS]|nr:MAG: hypothetical protein EFT35_07790 [Methanophagales archaeon ANME-1-THS]